MKTQPSEGLDDRSSGVRIGIALQRALSKNQDLGLIVLVMAVIGLMLFPLPFYVMDGLIALNIGVSVMILMCAIYVPEALELSTFPSLLLFTTLLRLGLNIASTKLILLHAHAGQIIETFGRLVVGGNYIVGGVVFLIITIVQFIVIAKGSERVAEVGARFSLDAMPGKQMSIEADLRAGTISAEDARFRRRQIERESQLHGGMDGAMKFVKGDAIASLIISLICIVAGIAIGSMMRGMSIGDAAARYAVLTVGDGMVSQIPALFISIAAGVLTTRVSGIGKEQSNLGRDIAHQLVSQPRALMITGVVLLACMSMPGFPKVQFLLLAALMSAPALLGMRRARGKDPRPRAQVQMPAFAREGRREPPALLDAKASSTALALLVSLPQALFDRLRPDVLNAEVEAIRERLQAAMGIPFPGLRMAIKPHEPPDSFSILVYDVPIGEGRCQGDEPVEASISRRVEAVLQKHAALFIGTQEAKGMLTRAEAEFPEIAAEAVKAMPLQRLAEVLRRLVEEGISVRDIRAILETLAVWAPREKDTVMLVEQVRIGLARFITHKYSRGTLTLDAILLAPKIEESLRQTVQQSRGSFVPVAPDQVKRLCAQFSEFMQASPGAAPVLITRLDIRRYVRKVIEPYLPDLPVISYDEIAGGAKVNALGQAEL